MTHSHNDSLLLIILKQTPHSGVVIKLSLILLWVMLCCQTTCPDLEMDSLRYLTEVCVGNVGLMREGGGGERGGS